MILELKNTTPQTRSHPPATPSYQTTIYELNENRTMANTKKNLATNTDEAQHKIEDATKCSQPEPRIMNLDGPQKETKENSKPPPYYQGDSSKRRKPRPKAQNTKSMKTRHTRNPSRAMTKRRSRECESQHPPPHDTTPRISNLAK